MTNRKFYKTVAVLEFLSEEPIEPGTDWETIIYRARNGEISMRELKEEKTVLNGKEAAKALILQGSNPGLFRLTDNGEDSE
jgi:hypothetical protein